MMVFTLQIKLDLLVACAVECFHGRNFKTVAVDIDDENMLMVDFQHFAFIVIECFC